MSTRWSTMSLGVVLGVMLAWPSMAQPVLPHEPGEDGRIPQVYAALTNTHVVDVRTGNVLRDAVVVVRDGRIVSVSTDAPPAEATVLDLEGIHLLPGFMDGHWHGETLEGARRALESGVTTMKSAAVGNYVDVQMRELSKQGYIAGPDIRAAGVYVRPNLGMSALADPRLHKYLNKQVHGPEAVAEVASVDVERGVDWIKTRTSGTTSGPNGPDPKMVIYTEEEISAIVEEVIPHGVKVACHSHGKQTLLNAVNGGCHVIEHGTYMDEEVLQLMKAQGTAWSPTFTSVVGFLQPHDDYNSSATHIRGPHMLHFMRQSIKLASDMGVPLITSTDTQYGPRSNNRIYREITNFVDIGLTPLQALQSATIVSAEIYEIQDETGAIEPGLEADLVGVDGNPLEDIWAVHEPMFVMSNGRFVMHRSWDPKKHVGRKVEISGFGAGGPLP